MGAGQRRRGGTASKNQLKGWMWKEEDGGSGLLKEKAKRVELVAERGGVEAKPGRKERWQWKVSKRSWSVGADFLGANSVEFLPEGRVAKVHPVKTCCLTRVQVWQGRLSLVYEPVSKLVWQVEYQMWTLGITVLVKFLFECDICG